MDNMSLLLNMIHGQTVYVSNRILNKRDKNNFNATMSILREAADSSMSLDSFKSRVDVMKNDIINAKRSFLNKVLFKDDTEFRLFAFEVVEEITNSIESRFVNGSSKEYLNLLDSKIRKEVSAALEKSKNAKKQR